LSRSLGPELAPDGLRERGEGRDLLARVLQMREGPRQLVLEGGQDPVELGVHGLGVGLVEDGAEQGLPRSMRTIRWWQALNR
jgi:hypothetical protein